MSAGSKLDAVHGQALQISGLGIVQAGKGWRCEERSEDLFFKSQVSLAETCQDQAQLSRSFCADVTDEDSLSAHSRSFDESCSEVEICQDFFLKGCCNRGAECEYLHLYPSLERSHHRSRRVRAWLLQEMPEMFLGKWKRSRSFLN